MAAQGEHSKIWEKAETAPDAGKHAPQHPDLGIQMGSARKAREPISVGLPAESHVHPEDYTAGSTPTRTSYGNELADHLAKEAAEGSGPDEARAANWTGTQQLVKRVQVRFKQIAEAASAATPTLDTPPHRDGPPVGTRVAQQQPREAGHVTTLVIDKATGCGRSGQTASSSSLRQRPQQGGYGPPPPSDLTDQGKHSFCAMGRSRRPTVSFFRTLAGLQNR